MEDFFDALPRLIWHEDEPITWPSSVSLYFVSRLAAEHVKVVLTGEGSDELFGGYARYRFYLINQRRGCACYRLLPAALRDWVRRQVGRDRRCSPPACAASCSTPSLGRGDDARVALPGQLLLRAFSARASRCGWSRRRTGGSPYANYLRLLGCRGRHASLLDRMLYADQKTYLVELLMKQDQMSMACSIESRVPLLDHTLVEFAARVPDRLKIRGGAQKYIFKKRRRGPAAARHRLPQEDGLSDAACAQWLLRPAAAPLLAALRAPDGLLAAYVEPRRDSTRCSRGISKGVEDATDRIWRLLNLQLWGEVFLTGRLKPSLRLPKPHDEDSLGQHRTSCTRPPRAARSARSKCLRQLHRGTKCTTWPSTIPRTRKACAASRGVLHSAATRSAPHPVEALRRPSPSSSREVLLRHCRWRSAGSIRPSSALCSQDLMRRERFDRVVCDFLASGVHFPGPRPLPLLPAQRGDHDLAAARRARLRPAAPLYFRLQAHRMFHYEARVCRARRPRRRRVGSGRRR